MMSLSSESFARASLSNSFNPVNNTPSTGQGSARIATAHHNSQASGPSTFTIRDSARLARHEGFEQDSITVTPLPKKRTVYAAGLPQVLQEQLDRYYVSRSLASAPPPVTGTKMVSSSEELEEVQWYYAPTGEPLEATVQNFEMHSLAKESTRSRHRKLIWVRGATVGPYLIKWAGKSGSFDWGKGSVFNIWYGGGAKVPHGVFLNDDEFETVSSVRRRLPDSGTPSIKSVTTTESMRPAARASIQEIEVTHAPIVVSSSSTLFDTDSAPWSSDDANMAGPEHRAKRLKASHQTFTSLRLNGQAATSSSSSAPTYLREWSPARLPTISVEATRSRASASHSSIPRIIDLGMEESAAILGRGSRSVAQELDDTHLLSDMENQISLLVSFHFWSTSKDSAFVRSYKHCQNLDQLFTQARIARLWRPTTRYRVLELRLRDDDHLVTLGDPEKDESIENLETFNTFILEIRARVAKDVRDLVIDVKPVD